MYKQLHAAQLTVYPVRPMRILSVAIFSALATFVVAAPREVPGVTEPFMDVVLSSSVQGQIGAERFKEGESVKAGDVILELDSSLEAMETERRKLVAERTKSDFDATQVLFEKTKAVSKDELDKKRTEAAVAAAEHGIAQEQLRRRRIVAPFAGTIVEIFLQAGASCEPYKPLVRLVDTSKAFFVGHVDGSLASDLKVGQEVKLEVAGLKESVKAVIALTAPVVDQASGLARVKAVFDNASGKVRPGLAAKMIIE